MGGNATANKEPSELKIASLALSDDDEDDDVKEANRKESEEEEEDER